jgi:hypothetical protein
MLGTVTMKLGIRLDGSGEEEDVKNQFTKGYDSFL